MINGLPYSSNAMLPVALILVTGFALQIKINPITNGYKTSFNVHGIELSRTWLLQSRHLREPRLAARVSNENNR